MPKMFDILQRSLNQNWPISQEELADMASEMKAVLDDPYASHRDKLKAVEIADRIHGRYMDALVSASRIESGVENNVTVKMSSTDSPLDLIPIGSEADLAAIRLLLNVKEGNLNDEINQS